MWPLVLVASLGCYGQKLLGLVVPRRWVSGARTAAAVTAVPVALLAALTAQGTVADGTTLVVDARLAGIGVAGLLVALRRGFLVVLLGAVLTTALLRLVT